MSQRLFSRRLASTSALLLTAGLTSGLGLSACGQSAGNDSDPAPVEPVESDGEFVSHLPGQSGGRDVDEGGVVDGNADPEAPSGGDAERAITEADILKVEGDTLYALSRYSGLTI